LFLRGSHREVGRPSSGSWYCRWGIARLKKGLKMDTKSGEVERRKSRLLAKVTTSDGCWVWKPEPDKSGYGRFHWGDGEGTILAHRASYRLFVGPLPEGLEVHHECGNTRCVNPKHLKAASALEHAKADPSRRLKSSIEEYLSRDVSQVKANLVKVARDEGYPEHLLVARANELEWILRGEYPYYEYVAQIADYWAADFRRVKEGPPPYGLAEPTPPPRRQTFSVRPEEPPSGPISLEAYLEFGAWQGVREDLVEIARRERFPEDRLVERASQLEEVIKLASEYAEEIRWLAWNWRIHPCDVGSGLPENLAIAPTHQSVAAARSVEEAYACLESTKELERRRADEAAPFRAACRDLVRRLQSVLRTAVGYAAQGLSS
jgi:hypothetical protein